MRVAAIGKPGGCKLIRVDAEIEAGVIRTISVRGDFFAIPEEKFETIEPLLAGTTLEALASRFDALLAELGVEAFGISGAAVAEVLREALKNG